MYARLYACIPELALMPIQSDDSSLDDLLSPGILFRLFALLPWAAMCKCCDLSCTADTVKCTSEGTTFVRTQVQLSTALRYRYLACLQ